MLLPDFANGDLKLLGTLEYANDHLQHPGSPYYYYDLYFEKRRYQASTHLKNKTVAHRVECIKKAELAQRRAGMLPKKQQDILTLPASGHSILPE